MILHYHDWDRAPTAIIDTQTNNHSFLKYVKTLRAMGVKNHAWPLALHQPALQGVDPFDPDLPRELITMVTNEASNNYWYYLREVARVPQVGTKVPSVYLANRANMALNWCFLNNIDFANIMPRQCGKSVGADVLNNWLIQIAGRSLNVQLMTRGDDLRVKNIKRLKALRDLLPDYLNFYQKGVDKNNTEMLTCTLFENEYSTVVAQKDKAAADNAGRGMTTSIIQLDEAPYCANIHISLPVALAGAGTARDLAEANGTFYGNIYTTTAGKKDTPEGNYMYNLIHSGMYWNERLLDAGSREQAWDIVIKHSNKSRRLVNGTFSHLQIGKSNEWLRRKILEAAGDKESAERDYLNYWTSGSESSPLSVRLNGIIHESTREPDYVQRFRSNYMLNWYVPPEDLERRLTSTHLLLCVDPSNAVGQDGNGLVIMDLANLEVLGGCNITEANLLTYGIWLADLLIMFPNMTAVIENKGSGQAILDAMALHLITHNIDPFRRIFNRAVDNGDINPRVYSEVQAHSRELDESFYVHYKSLFGFNTSGQTRPLLYGQVLQRAAQTSAHLVNDKILSNQILALVKKNNRVDHPPGGHDDMVIAWLLGHWFANYGQNLLWYGIRPGLCQSMVSDNGAEMTPEEKAEQGRREGIMKRVNMLKERLLDTENPIIQRSLETQIETLLYDLHDADTEARVLEDLRNQLRDRKAERTSLQDAIRRHRQMAA